MNYCKESNEDSEIFTTEHSDTLQLTSGDVIHAIFVPENASGTYGEPVYLTTTIPEPQGVDAIEPIDLQLFPVPNNGHFTLTLGQLDDNAHVDILTASGILVHSEAITSHRIDFQLPQLPSGSYIVQYRSPKRTLSRHMLIKK